VDPDIVTILSGQDPSDILIFAPDYEEKNKTENKIVIIFDIHKVTNYYKCTI